MQRLVTISVLIILQQDNTLVNTKGKRTEGPFLKRHIWTQGSSPGKDTHATMVLPQTVQTRKFRMKSKKSALTYKLQHSGRPRSTMWTLQSTSLSFEHHAARNCLQSRISSNSWWQTIHALFLVMTSDTSRLQNIHLIHTYASKKNYSQAMNKKCLTFKCDLFVRVVNICIN